MKFMSAMKDIKNNNRTLGNSDDFFTRTKVKKVIYIFVNSESIQSMDWPFTYAASCDAVNLYKHTYKSSYNQSVDKKNNNYNL